MAGFEEIILKFTIDFSTPTSMINLNEHPIGARSSLLTSEF
jgi:hypothetical protein